MRARHCLLHRPTVGLVTEHPGELDRAPARASSRPVRAPPTTRAARRAGATRPARSSMRVRVAVERVGAELVDPVLALPFLGELGREPVVQAAVDLGAAADAAALRRTRSRAGPSAAHEPPWRYLATISCNEKGSSASGSTHGPSSRIVTVTPGAGQRGGGDRAARARPDDQHVGVDRVDVAPRTHGCELMRVDSQVRAQARSRRTARAIRAAARTGGSDRSCSSSSASICACRRRPSRSPPRLLEPRPTAEDDRLRRYAGPQVFGHRLQRGRDVRLDRRTRGGDRGSGS